MCHNRRVGPILNEVSEIPISWDTRARGQCNIVYVFASRFVLPVDILDRSNVFGRQLFWASFDAPLWRGSALERGDDSSLPFSTTSLNHERDTPHGCMNILAAASMRRAICRENDTKKPRGDGQKGTSYTLLHGSSWFTFPSTAAHDSEASQQALDALHCGTARL